MEQRDLKRLIKIEDRIKQLAEEYGLKCLPVEFDIVPPQKMLEIMAYRSPTNISNWKFGRDYERAKTIFDTADPNLPYEVVINDVPARAYLMKSNTLAVQALVIAHVYGHVNFFTENKWFQNSRRDIIEMMAEANRRFNEYEKFYGIDEVERTIDAGHAIQFHSSPFETETEKEKKKRVFEQMMKRKGAVGKSDFADLMIRDNEAKTETEIANYNSRLWRKIQQTTPVEPTEDILRFIIDNSRILEDWQKDILETLRLEGQYYWPIIKTKYMNEGWATYWHEIIMKRLFDEKLLNNEEHGQYNLSNSLVKAMSRVTMNPYLVGCSMWKEIKYRWDTGRHGMVYENCTDYAEKTNWDTKAMAGEKKIFEVMKTYTDWFFMQDYLTADMIDKLDMYIYQVVDTVASTDYVRTDHTAEQIRELIVNSFAHSGIPKIEVVNGNLFTDGTLELEHRFSGLPLDKKYTEETLKHINHLWGRPVTLKSKMTNGREEKDVIYKEKGAGSPKPDPADQPDDDLIFLSPFEFDATLRI